MGHSALTIVLALVNNVLMSRESVIAFFLLSSEITPEDAQRDVHDPQEDRASDSANGYCPDAITSDQHK
jgi:hypothetical protein